MMQFTAKTYTQAVNKENLFGLELDATSGGLSCHQHENLTFLSIRSRELVAVSVMKKESLKVRSLVETDGSDLV